MSADFGILFLLTGPQHAARLVVAIHALRRFYSGPVTVLRTRDETETLLQRMQSDARLNIDVLPIPEACEASDDTMSTYLTKTTLHRYTPYEQTLFMDADTMVVGSIEPLIAAVQDQQLVLTTFCGHTTQHPLIAQRLQQWRENLADDPDFQRFVPLLDQSEQQALPAVNVGVFAFARSGTWHSDWEELARIGRHCWLPDEIAMQLLLLNISHRMLSTHYNWAPTFVPPTPGVRILHFVGGTHMTHPPSRDIWLPVFRECCEQQIADIDSWARVESVAPA